jgi:hypothetical protein
MDGLDPNHPPPKQTRAVITRWEYTDPVGVPHPDVVDLVVEITNKSVSTVNQISAEVQVQWSEGPLDRKSGAAWGSPTMLPKTDSVSFGASESKTFRFPIDVSKKMAELAKHWMWPWALRATVTTMLAGKPVEVHQYKLPITPGD